MGKWKGRRSDEWEIEWRYDWEGQVNLRNIRGKKNRDASTGSEPDISPGVMLHRTFIANMEEALFKLLCIWNV